MATPITKTKNPQQQQQPIVDVNLIKFHTKGKVDTALNIIMVLMMVGVALGTIAIKLNVASLDWLHLTLMLLLGTSMTLWCRVALSNKIEGYVFKRTYNKLLRKHYAAKHAALNNELKNIMW